MNRCIASDTKLEAMRSMHGITSHYAMALVAYVTLKRSANLSHRDTLRLLGVGNNRFSAWSKRCFGQNVSIVVTTLLDGREVPIADTCKDESAKRAVDFILGNKS